MPRRPYRLRRICLTLLAAGSLGLLGGCANPDENPAVAQPLHEPGSGGVLVWGLPSLPRSIDPLLARQPVEQLLAAQVFEPLTGEVRGPQPLGGNRQPGLAEASASNRGKVWYLALRRDVTFQDGTPFDADAVVANFARWQQLRAGRRLLPEIAGVRAESDDRVRIRLARPESRFGEILASARLCVVSPRAFNARRTKSARIAFPVAAGIGPFRIGERLEFSVSLVPSAQWWGADFQLGPALRGVDFRLIKDPAARSRALRRGLLHVANGIFSEEGGGTGPLATRRELGDGQEVAVSRAVRGLSFAESPPLLSRVWLTGISR